MDCQQNGKFKTVLKLSVKEIFVAELDRVIKPLGNISHRRIKPFGKMSGNTYATNNEDH